MSASILLSKLSRVKKTGADRWMACCPAHQDKTASLSIKDLPDGRMLLHCFAGCEPDAVLAAIGLTFADIMPERLQGDFKPARFAFLSDGGNVARSCDSGVLGMNKAPF